MRTMHARCARAVRGRGGGSAEAVRGRCEGSAWALHGRQSAQRCTCSVAESHVRLIWPELAKRRAPRPAAARASSAHLRSKHEATVRRACGVKCGVRVVCVRCPVRCTRNACAMDMQCMCVCTCIARAAAIELGALGSGERRDGGSNSGE